MTCRYAVNTNRVSFLIGRNPTETKLQIGVFVKKGETHTTAGNVPPNVIPRSFPFTGPQANPRRKKLRQEGKSGNLCEKERS